MGDDPDPSNDESSDDESRPPSDEPPSTDSAPETSDSGESAASDGTVENEVDGDADGEVDANDADDATDGDDVAGEDADDVAGEDADDVAGEDADDAADADGDTDSDEYPDHDEVKDEVYGGEGDSLWDDADDADDADNADDADDDADDADDADGESFEEQLEQAQENNPPLDRDEVDEDPTMVPDADPYGMDEDADATADGEAGLDDEDDEFLEGPETDEEMPLAVHIEEMMKRLGVVFLFAGVATAIAFPSASEMINYLWSYHIPAPMENRPRLYGPLELVLTRLKVAGILGVIVGLPVFVYESYLFMRPGLYRTERRYYLAAVPTSLVLGGIGMLFAHFLVLPAIFAYFTSYTTGVAIVAYGLAETFNLIVMLISFMAIVFQIPLFIMLAIMMGLVTREWLEDKRLVFWGTFFGIAFIFSPDPTGMAPIIVTITMIGLYEGTLALLRWTGN